MHTYQYNPAQFMNLFHQNIEFKCCLYFSPDNADSYLDQENSSKGGALNPPLIVQIAAGLQVKVNVSAGYCIQSNHGVKFKLLFPTLKWGACYLKVQCMLRLRERREADYSEVL